MSEATSSPNFNANLIPTALQLNTALRHGAADLAHLMQFLASGDSAVPAAGIVFGGLVVAGKTDDMRVDVSAGYGALYNGAVSAPEHPLEAAVLREDDVSPLLSDGDGTDPRIDVISVDPSSSLFDSEPLLVPNGGGATQAAFTRRGPGYEILVTEGVPDPSPSAPSTPTGSLKLAEVLVPAGMVASGGGTGGFPGVVITDYRSKANIEEKGPDSAIFGWKQEIESWGGLVFLLRLAGVRDAAGDELSLIADTGEHWPAFFRLGEPAGDATGHLYPMMIPGGRSHWLSAAFKSGSATDANASVIAFGFNGASNFDGVKLKHLTGTVNQARASCSFPTPARGASFDEYRVRHKVTTAAPTSITAQALAYDASADTVVPLSDSTSLTLAPGSYDTALLNPVEFVPDEGDIVGIILTVLFNATADSEEIDARVGMAAVTEGRA